MRLHATLWAVICGLVACAITSGPGRAQIPDGMTRYQRTEYKVAADKTYVALQTLENRVDSAAHIASLGTTSFTFDPSGETLSVVEAWVQQPDGARHDVPPSNIFTRPSAAAQTTPGFVGTQTTTIEFPGLRVGSIVHSKFRHEGKTPDMFGFNVAFRLGLAANTRLEVQIEAPEALPLFYGARGAFVTRETRNEGVRKVEASIDVGTAPPAEPQMVSPFDVGPVFAATTLGSYEETGALYAAGSADRTQVTPEIAALARSVVGTLQGREAARAIYDWVAEHIRYVAVFLDRTDGMIPHPAADVLRNGYGDCKDHVALMQALLAAVGIRSLPALVDWSTSMAPLPVWSSITINHVMIYLPDLDIYANPTSPFAAFGVLDTALADKPVIIASQAGEVRRTPARTAASNRYRATATLSVEPDGSVHGATTILISPDSDPPVRQLLESKASAEIVRSLLMATPEGGFGDLKTTNPRDLSRPLRIEGQWTSAHGVIVSTPSLYMSVPEGIDVRPNGDLRQYLVESGTRAFPFIVGARDYDLTYQVTLPAGSVIERLPPAVDMRNSAGRVKTHYEPTPAGFKATRHVVLDRTVYAPDQYPDLERLIYAVLDDRRGVIVYRPAP